MCEGSEDDEGSDRGGFSDGSGSGSDDDVPKGRRKRHLTPVSTDLLLIKRVRGLCAIVVVRSS